MSTAIDYETKRQLSDIQSKIASLDHRTGRLIDAPVQHGGQLVALTASRLARMVGNEAVADRLEAKAIAAPAMTTVATWSAELAAAGLPNFILSLERRSALASILSRSPQVSLLKVGTHSVPVAGAAPPAVVVAEGNAIPIQKGNFTALSLSPFKLCAVLHYTEELQNASNIEAITRTLLSQSISAGMDAVAFSTASPGGLLNGVTPLTASAATPAATALVADLKALLSALTSPSPDTTFAMSPQNALYASSVLPPGLLYPIVASSALAAGQVVAVDPQGVAAALTSEPRITPSISAAVHENDVPLPLSAVGSPNVVAAPLRSAFQTNTILVRVVAPVAWAARAGAVSAITAVSW